MWSKDPFSPGPGISQSVTEHSPAYLRRIILVVDTSKGMLNFADDIQRAIATLPADFDVKLVLADGLFEGITLNASGNFSTLRFAKFDGGADNVPALLKAWDLAAEKPGNNAIVWVHDPQRLLIHAPEELIQRWNNRPYGPTLYSIQATRGADEIEKALDGVAEIKSVARAGNLEQDLKDLFARLTGQTK